MPSNSSQQIIKNGAIEPDGWALIETLEAGDSDIPADGDIIVPLKVWQEQSGELANREGQVGVWLDSDEGPEAIASDLDKLPLVAINFPAFTDGRGYSYARLLRERYNFAGEVRAIGDIAQDQIFYMRRCGFDSFALKEGKDINEALNGLETITQAYQAATDQPEPLFRRR